MSVSEIERVRGVSRSKDKGPWVDWWDEMARKTVMRRCAKAAPTASELERLMARDDEEPSLPSPEDLPALPARPTRADYIDGEAVQTYVVTTEDGETEEVPFDVIEKRLSEVYAAAGKRGRDVWQGIEESNRATVNTLRREGHGDMFERLSKVWTEAEPQDGKGKKTETKDTPPAEDAQPSPASTSEEKIPIPVKKGVPDYETWLQLLFKPAMRATTNVAELAMLLGDHEDELKAALKAVGEREARAFEQEKLLQFEKVKN